MKQEANKTLEMRIYAILGVRLFRSLVFRLEKLLHHRDQGTHTNYHLGTLEPAALDAYIKYLYYNGVIHTRNTIFAGFYVLLRLLFGSTPGWIDGIVAVLTVKDLYCVMLQRYNFLRIRQKKLRLEAIRQRKITRRAQRITAAGLKDYDMTKREADLAFIRRLRTCIENREIIVISGADVESLNRLGTLLNTPEGGSRNEKFSGQETGKPNRVDGQ